LKGNGIFMVLFIFAKIVKYLLVNVFGAKNKIKCWPWAIVIHISTPTSVLALYCSFSGLCFLFTESTIVTSCFVLLQKTWLPISLQVSPLWYVYLPRFCFSVFFFVKENFLGFKFCFAFTFRLTSVTWGHPFVD
jgi:hypothetical protein